MFLLLRLVARAAARFNCARVDAIPVVDASGKTTHMELKESRIYALIGQLLEKLPETIEDPQKNEKYTQHFFSYALAVLLPTA